MLADPHRLLPEARGEQTGPGDPGTAETPRPGGVQGVRHRPAPTDAGPGAAALQHRAGLPFGKAQDRR
jgi:hypothetical protein